MKNEGGIIDTSSTPAVGALDLSLMLSQTSIPAMVSRAFPR